MNPGYEHIEDVQALMPAIPEESIISRSIYKDEEIDVTLFGFAAGQELTEHTASRAAILHFLEGEATLRLGQEEQQAGPGTWVYMAPRLPHSIQAQSRTLMLLTLLP